ncbi:HNH endonuclease [Pseudomonas alloputida]|uniref:HNH endonuclease n=1 Tax=Pseudomonas TaxID=286 RepID=UPI003EECAD6F
MQFFWVNLGATHKEAKNGQFLWAPLSSQSKTGKEQFRLHWDNVAKVQTGDLIFCYHDNYIRGIATAKDDAHIADRPPRPSFREWQNKGNRVDINYNELKRPVRSDDIAELYMMQFDSRTKPRLFNSAGGINQIYMASLPADAGLFLLEQAGILIEYEDRMIDNGSSQKVSNTTRTALIEARVGQGAFRSGLLSRWASKCALTGLQNPNLLVASHIHAWSLADNTARLDTDNGLLLAAHIDRLFDSGLISFSQNGEILISDMLNEEERHILRLDEYTKIDKLNDGNRMYLAKHRKRFSFS